VAHTACSDIIDTLEDFLGEEVAAPNVCYESAKPFIDGAAPRI